MRAYTRAPPGTATAVRAGGCQTCQAWSGHATVSAVLDTYLSATLDTYLSATRRDDQLGQARVDAALYNHDGGD